jgi:hypothetical protein
LVAVEAVAEAVVAQRLVEGALIVAVAVVAGVLALRIRLAEQQALGGLRGMRVLLRRQELEEPVALGFTQIYIKQGVVEMAETGAAQDLQVLPPLRGLLYMQGGPEALRAARLLEIATLLG